MIGAGRIGPQPWMNSAATRTLMTALTSQGAPARFVGGCVRDAVIGRAVRDIDIATATRPESVVRLLGRAGIRTLLTGLSHGTVTAVIDGAGYEVTTLRRDVETDGRHAVVNFTDDWTTDAQRRDFTINAMFCDPNGTIYDPTGGLADLRAGRVRFVGAPHARITEDVLRLLRFFRFNAWYGAGAPDADAMAACRDLAPGLAALSAERVWAELAKTLMAPDPSAAFALMDKVDALSRVLTEARHLDRLSMAAAFEVRIGAEPSAIRRLAPTLDCRSDLIPGLAARLRMSRVEGDRLVAATANGKTMTPRMDEAGIRRSLYRWRAPAFGDALTYAAAAGPGSDWDRFVAVLKSSKQPALPLTGADILAAGIAPGARVGELIAAVEDWWVDQEFAPDRAACLDRLADLIGR